MPNNDLYDLSLDEIIAKICRQCDEIKAQVDTVNESLIGLNAVIRDFISQEETEDEKPNM